MSALSTRPKGVTFNIRERTRGLVNPLNLHWAGVGLLGLVNLYLLIHMGLAYRTASSQDAEALNQQRTSLMTAKIAAKPLQGLDAKLKTASEEADRFSVERLPVSYSEVATEIGKLVKSNNVRYQRATYTQSAVDGDQAGQLTQVQIDAGLSGDYRSLVTFINQLERDKVFFLISGVTLTGQQTGVVNLRIRIVTYLRGLGSAEEMQKYQLQPASIVVDAATTKGGGAQ